MSEVDLALEAIRGGELAVIPTDTVYGLACDPDSAQAVERLATVKRRTAGQPIALVVASLDRLFDRVPELRGRAEVVARALLPGPYTLVIPNPGRRYPLLAGSRPDTIGVRVPELTGVARELLADLGVVAATSANLHGGVDPRTLSEVPDQIRESAVLVDGGTLPGAPSTVVDLTGREPSVVREGAVAAVEVLAHITAVLDG